MPKALTLFNHGVKGVLHGVPQEFFKIQFLERKESKFWTTNSVRLRVKLSATPCLNKNVYLMGNIIIGNKGEVIFNVVPEKLLPAGTLWQKEGLLK